MGADSIAILTDYYRGGHSALSPLLLRKIDDILGHGKQCADSKRRRYTLQCKIPDSILDKLIKSPNLEPPQPKGAQPSRICLAHL